jgi:hypothetical protein
MTSKNEVLTYILMYICKKFSRSATLLTPLPLCLLLLPTWGWEKSRWTVGRSQVQHQSGFLSVSGLGPRGWQVLNRVRSLILSKWTAGATPIWASSQNQQPLRRGDTSYMPTHHHALLDWSFNCPLGCVKSLISFPLAVFGRCSCSPPSLLDHHENHLT